MADVILNLIDPLEARFSWRDKTPQQIDAAKRDMVEAFRGHAIEDLKAALVQIVLNRKFSTMPTVGDINDVVSRVVAARKAEETKPKAKSHFLPAGEAMEALVREKEAAQDWARDWLRKSPLGQEALRDGWCRPLHNLIWQIKYNRTRQGRECGFTDIKLDDIATQSMHGAVLIENLRRYQGLSPKLERAIVLKEQRT